MNNTSSSDAQYTVVLRRYDHPWQPGAEMVCVWRVLSNELLNDGDTRLILDRYIEEPDADPLVVLRYQKGVLPIVDGCFLVLWRDEVWTHYLVFGSTFRKHHE